MRLYLASVQVRYDQLTVIFLKEIMRLTFSILHIPEKLKMQLKVLYIGKVTLLKTRTNAKHYHKLKSKVVAKHIIFYFYTQAKDF